MKFLRGLIVLSCTVSAAQASTLGVRVLDAEGNPVPRAVVMLEPASGKLPVAPQKDIEITQARRAFHPPLTVVPVGTQVSFPNLDSVRHHVYSFSPAKNFELKLYSGVPAKPVVFDKPGIAVLGCNIHDNMVAWVVVVDTPHYAVSGPAGKAGMPGVAAGAYRLRVWHPGMRPGADMVTVPLQVTGGDAEHDVRIEVAGVQP